MRFNVSQDEYDQIVEMAVSHNKSISDYCRYALLNELYFDQAFKKIQEDAERLDKKYGKEGSCTNAQESD
jgi:hypothetical protein